MAATTPAPIKELTRSLGGQVALLAQLVKSARAAHAELKRKQSKAEKDKLQAEKSQKEAAEETRNKNEERDKTERKRLAVLKDGAVFKIQLGEAGHKQIPVFGSMEVVRASLETDKGDTMQAPRRWNVGSRPCLRIRSTRQKTRWWPARSASWRTGPSRSWRRPLPAGQDDGATWSTLKDRLRGLTQTEAIAMRSKGYYLYSGTHAANQALVIPPAFFVAM